MYFDFSTANATATDALDPTKFFDVYTLLARYYDPVIGEFTSFDSFQAPPDDLLDANKYLYCCADPINGSDPSGHTDLVSLTFGNAIRGTIGLIGLAGIGALAYYFLGTQSGQLTASRIATLFNFHSDITAGIKNLNAESQQFSSLNSVSGTYPQAALSSVLQNYSIAFPNITNRACKTAEEQYELSLKRSLSQVNRQGITFVPGALVANTNLALDDSTDNVLILMPTADINNMSDANLLNPSWYNTPARKGILFFYPGVSPTAHIGNLYDAITNHDPNFKPVQVQAFGAQKF